MLKCCNIYSQYNLVKPKKLIQLEEKYINSAIKHMIINYIKNDELIDKLKPITRKRKIKGQKVRYTYNIQIKEYETVDIDTIMRLMPIGFLSCFNELSLDVPEFLSRKIIKILKMILSNEQFELDIVEKTLLFYMIDNNEGNFKQEFIFKDKKELIDLEVDTYIKDLIDEFCDDEMDITIDEDKALAYEIYKEAFFNLYHLLQLEKTGEVNIMYDNFDEDKLVYNNIIDAFNLKIGKSFNFNVLLELMTEINMSIPFEFLQLCDASKYPKSTYEFIQKVEDMSNELEYILTSIFDKNNRIIDMPQKNRNEGKKD